MTEAITASPEQQGLFPGSEVERVAPLNTWSTRRPQVHLRLPAMRTTSGQRGPATR